MQPASLPGPCRRRSAVDANNPHLLSTTRAKAIGRQQPETLALRAKAIQAPPNRSVLGAQYQSTGGGQPPKVGCAAPLMQASRKKPVSEASLPMPHIVGADQPPRPLVAVERGRTRLGITAAGRSPGSCPMASACIPVFRKQETASVGLATIGSRRLKLVFSRTGTPVSRPNSSIRP